MRRYVFPAAVVLCTAILVALCSLPNGIFYTPYTRRRLLYQSPFRGFMKDYEAPLLYCERENRAPNEYIVYLLRGYSLEQHKQTIRDGVLWNSTINNIFPGTRRHGDYYAATLQDPSLAAIRADIGVKAVHCDFYGELIDSVFSGPYSTIEGEELERMIEECREICRETLLDDDNAANCSAVCDGV